MTNTMRLNSAETVRSGVKEFETRFRGCGFRCFWEQKIPDVGTVTMYYLGIGGTGGSLVMILDYERGGWEAFTPVTRDGLVSATLDAIAKHCGIAANPEEKKGVDTVS